MKKVVITITDEHSDEMSTGILFTEQKRIDESLRKPEPVTNEPESNAVMNEYLQALR